MRQDYELRYGIPGEDFSRSVNVTCTAKQLPLIAKAVMRGQKATWILAKFADYSIGTGSQAFFYSI